jgi:RNA-directed DNA polymerase
MNYIEKLIKEMQKHNEEPEYIELVTNYAINLIDKNVVVIFDIEHLSLLTKYSNQPIETLLNTSKHYKLAKIPKKNSEIRLVYVPSFDLKQIQKWILTSILEKLPISKNAIGFRKGYSILDNAKPHTNKKCLLCIDFKDYFPSITYERVFNLFKTIGYTNEVANSLTNLCTYNGYLPQGAPTSPYIANLVTLELDNYIEEYIEDKEISYTRYADDITFSSDRDLSDFILPIKEIIKNHGFQINHKKTRIKYPHQRQMVTGLVVNNQKPAIPRKHIKKLKQEIYYCKKYGVHGHLTNKKDRKYYSNYKNYLFGMAYYFKMIDKKIGQKFIDEIKEIPWEY